MTKLKFEMVGDLRSRYPYVCVYIESRTDPFMELSVAEDKTLFFSIYPTGEAITLTFPDLDRIRLQAIDLLADVMADKFN